MRGSERINKEVPIIKIKPPAHGIHWYWKYDVLFPKKIKYHILMGDSEWLNKGVPIISITHPTHGTSWWCKYCILFPREIKYFLLMRHWANKYRGNYKKNTPPSHCKNGCCKNRHFISQGDIMLVFVNIDQGMALSFESKKRIELIKRHQPIL